MLRKTVLFIFLVAPMVLFSQQRQQRLEIVLMGGGAIYNGDLGGDQTKFTSDYFKKIGPAFGGGLRLHVTNFLALRGNFNYAMVSGADSFANTPHRKSRNLSFRSPIYEGSLLLEISLINWRHITGQQVNSSKGGNSNLYLFGGMSFFSFNPQAYYQGRWYDLQPLGTEGQGIDPSKSKYKLSSNALVFGLGYRVRVGERFSIGFETGLRSTNTDYLDDVSTDYYDNSQIAAANGDLAAALADRHIPSEGEQFNPYPEETQRGSPKVKDWYGLTQITIAIKLGKNQGGYNGRSKRFRTRSRCFQF